MLGLRSLLIALVIAHCAGDQVSYDELSVNTVGLELNTERGS